jgi:cobalamin synthase
MPAQYALAYYLGSTILGSILLSVLVILLINIPNGTFYLDGTGFVFLISCGTAMVGSLPFHAWLNWVWYKKVGSQPYEDFFKSFLRKYWVGSTLCLFIVYTLLCLKFIYTWPDEGGMGVGQPLLNMLPIYVLFWISYVPLGWWIIKRLKGAMQPSETDV